MDNTTSLQTAQINFFIQKSSHLQLQGRKEPLLGVKWLDIPNLPTLYWRNTEEAVPLQVVYYFIATFIENKGILYTKESSTLLGLLEIPSIHVFLDEVIIRWKKDSKNRWVLGFIALLGQEKYLSILTELVAHFAGWNSVMSANTVDAMGLISSKQTLHQLILIREKVECKATLLACQRILEKVKSHYNFSTEQLLDYVIPSFGLSSENTWLVDYGSRQFEAALQQDFHIQFKNIQTQKIYKQLPKLGKKDNPKSYNDSMQYYESNKSNLREEMRRQKTRLLNAFIACRKWESNQWKHIFFQNSIMNLLGQGLLWGVYEGNQLKVCFRINNNNDLVTLHNELYYAVPNLKIGLVHPLEITYEQRMEWLVQFDEQSIKMPFQQLNRPVFTELKNQIDDFRGYTIHVSSLRAQLFYTGWKRGDVHEDGKVYEFYKELTENVVSKIQFSGEKIGYYEEEEGYVTIDKLVLSVPFYTVSRRIYSELFYEMRKIANTAQEPHKVAS